MAQLVLASTSASRRSLLASAGLSFECAAPEIDERLVEGSLEGRDIAPADVALILAKAKALAAGARNPDALIVGADQTLSLGGQIFHKPNDLEAARRQLLTFSGKTHELNSAVVLARGEIVIWHHVAQARMTMRQLDPAFIDRYLARIGMSALSSVGAYQIEGEGIQLFERIEGDQSTIMGLPLLPLLFALRAQGVLDG